MNLHTKQLHVLFKYCNFQLSFTVKKCQYLQYKANILSVYYKHKLARDCKYWPRYYKCLAYILNIYWTDIAIIVASYCKYWRDILQVQRSSMYCKFRA